MRLAVIVGSQRKNSQSVKVGTVVSHRLLHQSGKCQQADLIDLAATPLPFWDVSLSSSDSTRLQRLGKTLASCHGFVIISPEWHGMVPAALKNFFLHYSADQFAHKPALIISISAGEGGAYPIAELRSSSYKNNRICYLPEHLIIRRVETVFNNITDDNDERAQNYLNKRLDYALAILMTYAEGMISIRKQLPDGKEFPNGM